MSREPRRSTLGALSPKIRAQAEDAHLVAHLHVGANGSHVLELATEGVLGYLPVHRQLVPELRRALDAFEDRCEQLDDQPDPIFARPPEKLVP
jgi:hypothetical protein